MKRKVMEYITMQCIWKVTIHNIDSWELVPEYKVSTLLRPHVKLHVQKFLFNPYATWKDKVKYLLFQFNLFTPVMRLWIRFKELERCQ